jgi:hypothetical protein
MKAGFSFMWNKAVRVILLILRIFNVFLMIISPMALLMLIVGFLMTLDARSTHRRLQDALDAEVRTVEAEIASCYPEEGFCYAQYVDVSGEDRYDRLDLGYYPDMIRERIGQLERGDVVEVRYSLDRYETEIVIAEYYQEFATCKGYYADMVGIMAVSWFILVLHPEIMLVALVDDVGKVTDPKWKRITGRS